MLTKRNTWAAFWQAMKNGWLNRCPQCGEGRIWNGNDLNERCTYCSLEYEHDKAAMGGLTWSIILQGVLLVVGIPLVELVTDLSFLQHLYLWVAVLLFFHAAFYRNIKGQWIGVRWVLIDRVHHQ